MSVSGICLNLPMRAPSVASTTDEGGFNEPSPEIKAKLKPSYTFDPADMLPDGDSATDAAQQPQTNTLHYVDFGYPQRVVAEVSNIGTTMAESSELQQHQQQHNYPQQSPQKAAGFTNGFGDTKESTVLYATIKPEIPPPADLFLNADGSDSAEYDMVTHSEEKIYYSPQAILNQIQAIEEPPAAEEPASIENMYGLDLVPPPRPPLPSAGPLLADLHADVAFADADVDVSPPEEMAPPPPLPPLAPRAPIVQADEDIMTADMEERLLSSRYEIC